MRISTPSTLGDSHKLAILNLVRRQDGLSREEIARRLSLSKPAAGKNVNALLEAGILEEYGLADSSMGRKPILLRCNDRLLYVIAVEIMPHGIRAALADFCGGLLHQTESPSNVRDSAAAILKAVYEAIQTLLDHCPKHRDVACICLANPGCTDLKHDFNLLSAYQEAWDDVDVRAEVEEKFGIPTTVMNDVELDLLGEWYYGAGTGHKNILLVKYGDGFACRSIVEGNLFRGARCTAGEIGYSINSINDVPEKFSSPGPLEQRLSHDIFAEYAQQAGQGEVGQDINFALLTRRAAGGDALAGQFVREVTDLISISVVNTVLVMNPELLILAGDAVLLGDKHIAHMRKILENTCPYVPEIRRAQLGQNSGIYGGVSVALRNAEKQLVELWK